MSHSPPRRLDAAPLYDQLNPPLPETERTGAPKPTSTAKSPRRAGRARRNEAAQDETAPEEQRAEDGVSLGRQEPL